MAISKKLETIYHNGQSDGIRSIRRNLSTMTVYVVPRPLLTEAKTISGINRPGTKLSQNGVAGFLLANGALSDDGTELKIREQLIRNNLVEAIIILPRSLFYTTDISVTLWILNKNKKARVVEQNGELKRYRNREKEILFMDLRQMGSPYEKKYGC